MTTTPTFRIRKVTLESLGDDCWLSMTEEGDIREFRSAQDAYAWFQRRDVKSGESTATILEWRNTPAGFAPPEARS